MGKEPKDKNKDKANKNKNILKGKTTEKDDIVDTKDLNFFVNVFYSSFRLDKIADVILKNKKTITYLLKLFLILSSFISISMTYGFKSKINKTRDFISKLPDFKYENNEIIGDIDAIIPEKNNLIIINTVDEKDKIIAKYEKEIKNTPSYLLFTKDKLYVQPRRRRQIFRL